MKELVPGMAGMGSDPVVCPEERTGHWEGVLAE